MPYIGVLVTHNKRRITIKFHGPLDVIPLWPAELRSQATQMLDSYDEIPNINTRDKIERLAGELRDKYCDGHDLLWVDVELLGANNLIFGATAERVLVS